MRSQIVGGFTDIHTHLFPSVDDGAPNTETTLKLARLAWKGGTKKLFLTPHFAGRFKRKTPEWYREAFSVICDSVRRELPGLELYLGSEIAFEVDVPELLSEKKLLSLNDSDYVLLELQMNMSAQRIVDAVYEIVRNGFSPILAHVERFDAFRKQDGLIDRVLDNGALIQLNADSVMGKNGFFVKRYCHKLLKENKVHFIASDAHDTKRRPPILSECYKTVSKEYGVETADRLFSRNACVLFGEEKERESI